MKITRMWRGRLCQKLPRRILLIMRFSIVLLFGVLLQVSATSLAQKVVIHKHQMTFKELFSEVESQTGLITIYNNSQVDMSEEVVLKVDEMELTELYQSLLTVKGLTFDLVDDYIVIKKSAKQTSAVEESQQPEKKITIRGTIKDEHGEPLPFVAISLKGTTIGTVSTAEGTYQLEIPNKPDNVLMVTSLGYKPQEINIQGRTQIDIVLESDMLGLDEVVVTGYQTISKERATGSFNNVSREQLDKPVVNIATRLIGNVSGVQATIDEEGNPTFEIRGKSSLYADSKPLIVVDGFAIEGDFASINPNDVESITILKDAAAASIWGARSANGVIVVTTKSGRKLKAGTLNVSVNSFMKYAPKPDLDYLLNTATPEELVEYEQTNFGKRWKGGLISDSELSIVSSSMTPGLVALNEHRLGYLSDQELESVLTGLKVSNNRNQIKEHLISNPFVQQHNINIGAASERFSNNLSLMYEDRQTYLTGNDREKFMVNYRNYAKVFKWLDFSFSGMYMVNKANNNNTLADIKTIAPYDMLLDKGGNRRSVYKNIYMPNFERYWPAEEFPYPDMSYNPITEMEGKDFSSKQIQSRFQAALIFKLMDGLKFNSQVQYESFNVSNRDIQSDETFATSYNINYYTNWDRGNNTFSLNIPEGDYLDQSRSTSESYTFRNQLSYDNAFGKHAINAIVGMEVNERVTQTVQEPRVYGYDDAKLSVGRLPNGLGSYTNPNLYIYNWMGYRTTIYTNADHQFTYNTDRYVSAYCNAAYTYNEKYTLSGSARTDASNLITDDPSFRYSPFWSIGGSWQLSKESFMQDVSWIERLALRVTYGYNGNVDRSTSFLPLINMYPTNNLYTNEPYASISSYGNPTLRWEKTGTFDLGVDYSLLGGKLFGKVDVYHKAAEDLIASVSIPQVNGVGSQKMNVADMVNKGIEIELGTRLPLLKNNVVFYGNANVSYNHNEITKLYNAKFYHSDILPWNDYYGALVTSYVEGENANTLYGSHYVGLHNDGTPEQPNMQPKIEGKDGTLYGFSTWPADDVMNYAYAQGTTVAPWVTGLSLGFKVRNFDVSCIMTGKFGHVFRRTSYNYNAVIPNQRYSEVVNGNPDEIMPLPQNDNESRYYFWDRFWKSFSYLTESANHVRMQEVNLTYNLPKKVLNKIGVANAKVYGQANNLFSIYANSYNEDPEYPLGSYKPTPVYTIGLQVTFD